MTMNANWSYPTSILFGAGRIGELPKVLKEAGIRRPLLVTDAGLAALPVTQSVLGLLKEGGVTAGLYSDVKPNPVSANVKGGVKAYRDGGHDGVIAFGGGSGLDTGKVIAFMVGQTRPIWDFEDVGDWWTRADPTGIAPIIGVPTTAGTGSEVGRAGVITDEVTHTKKVIFHPKMMPGTVIADPELTVGMPRFITVGTGMDALAHCLEAHCAPVYHPMAEGMAIEGIRLALENLPRVFAEPGNIEARGHMMSAAAIGATAFQKGLGAIHSLSHPVGALYDTHHGMTNAVFMPYVLVANRVAIEDKICRLAAYLGLPATFEAFLEMIVAVRAELEVPHTLADFKIPGDRRTEIADKAIVDPTASGNPRELTHDLALEIFDRAMEGRLTK
jgi:alcohol dehydrogenase